MRDARSQRTAGLSLLEFALGPPSAEDDGWFVGASTAGQSLQRKATAMAGAGFATVIIGGPPGSGKLHVARWLHGRGPRGNRPLACLDAARDPSGSGLDALLRSSAGNIVVRRVEDASVALMAALQQLAASGMSAGDRGLFVLTAMPIAALRARSLAFEQLVGRSSGALLEVPPLTARPDDVAALARRLVDEAARRYQRPLRGVSDPAIMALQRHPLPGNVRQLASIIDLAVLRSTGDSLTADDLGLTADDLGLTADDLGLAADDLGLAAAHATSADAGCAELTIRLPGSSLRDIELRAIKLALRLADGRLIRAAELLGVTRHALRRKLGKFGIEGLRARSGHSPEPDLTDDSYI